MCEYTLDQLETLFITELESSDISDNDKYSSYSDLSAMTNTQLWTHANDFGYKEQRIIFKDCSYNEAFYCNYLSTYRTSVLEIDPYFNWQAYIQSYSLAINSEYYALLDFMDRQDVDISSCVSVASSLTSSISSTQAHYTIIGEESSYELNNHILHYGNNQSSTENFGMVIPFKSKLLRVYLMYHFDDINTYNNSTDYSFNEVSTSIKLDLYVNGSQSDYYMEEYLDPSKNMVLGLFKSSTNVSNGCIINYNTIELEQHSIISLYCSELLSLDSYGEYCTNPFNPRRNRVILVLEPL
jgi:hypothetical protein